MPRADKHPLAGSCALAVLALVLAAPARADVIDGEWCHDSSRIAIEGPKVLTMGGHTINGDYTRHHFVYAVPDGEEMAGGTIDMRLLNEETVSLTRLPKGGAAGGPETWKRCKPVS